MVDPINLTIQGGELAAAYIIVVDGEITDANTGQPEEFVVQIGDKQVAAGLVKIGERQYSISGNVEVFDIGSGWTDILINGNEATVEDVRSVGPDEPQNGGGSEGGGRSSIVDKIKSHPLESGVAAAVIAAGVATESKKDGSQ